MPEVRIDERSTLARLAAWRSRPIERPVTAARVDAAEPFYFVGNEVLVDARDRDLVEELVARGGTVVPEPPLPPVPDVIQRRRDVDMSSAPTQVLVRFDQTPRTDGDLGSVLEQAQQPGEQLVFSSEVGAGVAALIAPHRLDGRRVGLNLVGQPFSMPLSAPLEGSGLVYGQDPTQWQAFAGRTRMVQAWQLVDSVRQLRGTSPVWIAVCDSGFWLDGAGAPVVAGGQPASDFGAGVLQWNLVNEGQPVPGGTTSFHGNQVASAALAAVGNSAGAAGAGGTVASPAFFHTGRNAENAMRALKLCVWWGIDIINFSWGFWGQSEFWFDSDSWDDTFSWAADNDVISIAAAGNSSWNLPDDQNVRPATRTPRTLTVGWLNTDDTAHPNSNYGSSVWLWAPGTSIQVAPDGGATAGSTVQGTSFAAPIVAGVAAMMRACNPALSADDVRRILVDTGWQGSGRVSRGLDAYAAVWTALGYGLPDTNEPNGSASNPVPLLAVGPGGSLSTAMGAFTAISTPADYDYWSFTVDSLSSVSVTVDWYERLANLSVLVADMDPEADDPTLARTGGPSSGRQVLTGLLRRGRYRVRVSGSGPTAYRLVVRLSPARLAPDAFEANDSFDTATVLQFEEPQEPVVADLHPAVGARHLRGHAALQLEPVRLDLRQRRLLPVRRPGAEDLHRADDLDLGHRRAARRHAVRRSRCGDPVLDGAARASRSNHPRRPRGS